MQRDRLRRLTDAVYDTMLSRDGWGHFLLELSSVLGCTAPGIGLGGAGPKWQVFALAEESWLRSYDEQYAVDLASTAAAERLIESSFPVQRLSTTSWNRWPFHVDWMRPKGLAHGLGFYSGLRDGSLMGFAAYRERGTSGFDEEDLELIEALRPHMRRVVDLQRRVDGLVAARSCASEILDHLEIGLVLLDARVTVLFANDVARRIARRDDGISLSSAALRVTDRRARKRLEALVCDALPAPRDGIRGAGGAVAVPRRGDGPAYELVVSPAPPAAESAGPLRGAAVMVLIHDTERAPTPDPEMLREMYTLTAAEARVASQVASGLSVEDIADAAAVSRQTVRNQLKTIFDKTGTHRQAELTHRVRSGLATHMPRRRR